MKINCLILFFLCLNLNLDAQTLSEKLWTPSSGIYALESDTMNNLIYAGGEFSSFMPGPEPNGAFVSLSTGLTNYAAANPDLDVFCSVSDGNGGFFVGGMFSQVGDSLRKAIVHLDAAGNVTSWNPQIVGGGATMVRSLVLKGDSLFVGGYFGQIGGETRYNFAVVSASNGTLYSWAPAISGTVYSIVAKNNGLYVGGAMSYYDGTTSYDGIVRFDLLTGNPSNWKPSITGFLNEIEVVDSTVYISGFISQVNGQVRNGFAAIYEIRDSSGLIVDDSLSDLVIDADGYIYDLLVKGDTLLVGGQFATFNTFPRSNFAAINRLNGQLYNWSIDVDGYVSDVVIKNTSLYIAGAFALVDGTNRQSLAEYDLQNLELTSWNPSVVPGIVHDIEIADSNAYAGGSFYSVGVKHRSYIASLNPLTGIPTNWAPELNGKVWAIHIKDDKILIGGDFTLVNGITRNHFAAFDRASGNLLSWNPSVNGPVRSICSKDSLIFVGGGFTEVDGIPYGNLVAFDAATQTAETWNPGMNDTVQTLFAAGDYLYAGGDFTSSNAAGRERIARFNYGSFSLDGWNPDFDNTVRAIAQNGSQILVGGEFSSVNSTSRNYFASLQKSTGVLNALDLNPNEYVRSIQCAGNKAYLGGRFTTIGGQVRNYTAELDVPGGIITPWLLNPSIPFGSTVAMCVYDSTLIVGGSDFDGATGHLFGVEHFSSFIPAPFSVNVFAHPSAYNSCSGNATVQLTGAPGFVISIDSNTPVYSNGTVTIDSLCAGIHALMVLDYYQDTISQYFVVGQDSGIFVLDTIPSGTYNLFGLSVENCGIDYATIDTAYIVSSTVTGNQTTFVWVVEDSFGIHTDSATYNLYLVPGDYYVQIGFYCLNKSQNEYYSLTQLVYINEGDGVAAVDNLFEKNHLFTIFPNPANDQVRVHFSGSDAELTVYDLQGKVVLKDQIRNQDTISLENFERGVYLFDLRNSQGKSVQRVVKQ